MHNLICTCLRVKSAVKENFQYTSAKLQSSVIWWIANYQTSDLLGEEGTGKTSKQNRAKQIT